VGKRPLGRFTPTCLDNIKMDLQEMGFRTLILLIWLRIRANGRLL
jgi:hypothetical protein